MDNKACYSSPFLDPSRVTASPMSSGGGRTNTNEMRGWWKDPRDPVHIIHACASGEFGIRSLWLDPDVLSVLAQKHLRMEESPGFFLNDVNRVTAMRYSPSSEDVLRAYSKTVGVINNTFVDNDNGVSKKRIEWNVWDVGGLREERNAWSSYLNDGVYSPPLSPLQVLKYLSRRHRIPRSNFGI